MFYKLLFLLSFATIFANSLVSFSICFQFYAENSTIAQIALAIALATLAALTKCTYYTLDVDAMMPVWALMENGGGRGADVSLLAFVHARSTRASNIGGQMPNKSISLSSIKSL